MRLNLNKVYFILLCLVVTSCHAQPLLDDDSAVCVAFYNVENLFDTENDKRINDEEYMPQSKKQWDKIKYQNKLDNLSIVLYDLGTKDVLSGAALIGLAEIENEKVLKDLVEQDTLKPRNYQYVHFDSPDKRGIDVALLYNPSKFSVLNSEKVHVNGFKKGGEKLYTRDILKVQGLLGKDTVYVFVNHWPSRRGGAEETKYLRKIAALALKAQTDKLFKENPKAKVILMGDFNDNPGDESLSVHLGTTKNQETVKGNEFYNPYFLLKRNGTGTTPYRGDWFMFDQVLFSRNLVQADSGYNYLKSGIFNESYLYQQGGKYDGYILRTYAGGKYLNGFSDHLPVYAILRKR